MTNPSSTQTRLTRHDIRFLLTKARERTIKLMTQIPDEGWHPRKHSFYSPVGWHFGHVGRTEEHWTCCRAMRWKPHNEELDFLYNDIPQNPKDNRVTVPDKAGTLEYLHATREQTLKALDEADFDSDNPLQRNGFAWVFAYKHECQHQETIAEMMHMFSMDQAGQAMDIEMAGYDWKEPPVGELVQLPGGTFTMGSTDLYGYDNEYQAHEVTIEPFELMNRPVTFYEYHEFIKDGGYRNMELWSKAARHWIDFESIYFPEFYANWTPEDYTDGNDKEIVLYGPLGSRSPDPAEPIMGISYYEAEAYARYRGLRLPTEREWEYAATIAPDGTKTRFPWGDEEPTPEHADFGLMYWAPRPVDQFPKGANPYGILGLAGGVWEWTSTVFSDYPGFDPFPYRGYSAEHFSMFQEGFDTEFVVPGSFKVCRGGSWATASANLYSTFRNWYPRDYRAGFLGLRLAK